MSYESKIATRIGNNSSKYAGIRYKLRVLLKVNNWLKPLATSHGFKDNFHFQITLPFTLIMNYTHRLATQEDAPAIAPLWKAFAQEREEVDPTMVMKPNFDFLTYINHQLTKPLSYCWVLEHENTIVGCLFIYFYDEAPPPHLPADLVTAQQLNNPFIYRRVGSVLGIYVQPEHRQPEAIKLLTNAAMTQAEEMKISDIDLLSSAEQTGMHALLERFGFTKAAVQYTKHYSSSLIEGNEEGKNLPSLHPPHPEIDFPEVIPQPAALPLRDPQTNEIIRNPHGKPVFLFPLKDEQGEILKTAHGVPIYPMLVRDPENNNWVFNREGELIYCPVLLDENGLVMEVNNVPQFYRPAYEFVDGKIRLMRDYSGNCVFCEVERDRDGHILRSPTGEPIFQQPLLSRR